MTDRDNFSDKKLALLPNSFWNSPPFYYEMAFSPWCFMCKRNMNIGIWEFPQFIMHNARVIGLQIASKETRKRSPYCIFGVIGDVKCTCMVGLKGKSAPRAASVTEISTERWIFCLTVFDFSRLGYSDNDQVSGPVEFQNLVNSILVYFWVQSE